MIINYKDLSNLRNTNIIFVIGTFDLLHHGHLYFLNKAKSISPDSKLLVVVISDKIASATKGHDRPIISEEQRAEILDALKVVDYVSIAPKLPTGQVAKDILETVKPAHSVATRSSWQNRKDPLEPKDTNLTIISDEIDSVSTTEIIQKIKAQG